MKITKRFPDNRRPMTVTAESLADGTVLVKVEGYTLLLRANAEQMIDNEYPTLDVVTTDGRKVMGVDLAFFNADHA